MIKVYLNIIFLLVSVHTFSQSDDFYSLYFSSEDIPGYEQGKIASLFYGEYTLKETDQNGLRIAAGESIFVDETGIYIEKNKVLSISREEVRENSKYTVRDGYLHGVIEGDSLMVSLDGELYYFLVPSKAYLVEKSTKLYELGANKYMYFSKEDDGLLVPSIVEFAGRSLKLHELTYPNEAFDFTKAEDYFVIEGDYPTYVAKPTAEEWKSIIQCFELYESYVKK